MRVSVTTRGGGVRLLLLAVAVLAGCAASAPRGGPTSGMGPHTPPSSSRPRTGGGRTFPPRVLAEATGGSGAAPGEALGCGGQALPLGWPDLSSGDAEALLAPFLRCASPGDYVALQERVDMPRLVEALDGWTNRWTD